MRNKENEAGHKIEKVPQDETRGTFSSIIY